MNHSIKTGAIVGVISVIISLLVYLINPLIFVKWWFGAIIFLILIGLVIYFGIQYRNGEKEGYLTFKEAYVHGLLVFVVAGIVGMLFNLLLFTVIDPELPEMLTEATIQQTYEMMQKFGAPQEAIDQAMEQVKGDIPKNFMTGGILKNFGFSIIGYLILSLITGAIVKRRKPEFE